MRVDLSVVVPVYRNAPTLAPLVSQVSDVLSGLGLSYEIVFVNDASPDDSLPRLLDLAGRHACVSVVDLARNVGQHAAVLHGLAHAGGRACAIMDADLQDRPASLAVLWAARSPGVAAVFGGRCGTYEQSGRHATSRLFKWVLHCLTGVPKDAGIFVLVERDLVEALLRFPARVPWIQAMIGCLGATMVSVPVARDGRAEGVSSYSAFGRLRTATKGLICVLEYRVGPRRRPYLDSAGRTGLARLVAGSSGR